MRHASHATSSDSTDASAPSGAAGKRTLTAQLAPRTLQAKGAAAGAIEAPPTSGGSALDPAVAGRAGATLGQDFSSVRVHEGGHADTLGTRAFAYGDDLHFASGAYDPSSAGGVSLIGHELTHVAQQRDGRVAPTGAAGDVAVNTDAGLEADADRGADRIVQGFDLGGFLDFAPRAAARTASPVAQGSNLIARPIVQGADLPAAAPAAAPAAPAASPVPPEVMARVGATFWHDQSGYQYQITSVGGFLLLVSPDGKGMGKNVEFRHDNQHADAWEVLKGYVVAHQDTIPPTVAPVKPPVGAAPPAATPPAEDGGLMGAIGDGLAAVGDAVKGAIDTGKALLSGGLQIVQDAIASAIGATPEPAPADGAAPAPADGAAPAPTDGAAPAPVGGAAPAAPGEPTSADVPTMSQFRWYSYGGRLLNVDEVLAAAQTIATTFKFGGSPTKITAPTADDKALGGSDGYFWFKADGTPTGSGKYGTQCVTFTVQKGETSSYINQLTMVLSDNPPGEKRPSEVTLGIGKSTWTEPVPESVRTLDLRHIPGNASCFATSASMMAKAGVHAVGNGDASEIRIVTGEKYDADGKVISVDIDAAASAKAKAYVDFETARAHPVFTGITYTSKNCNTNDDHKQEKTDHWVVITGRNGDEYPFNNPSDGGTGSFAWADGRFDKQDDDKTHLYVVSWVRPNLESLAEWTAHWQSLQDGAGAAPAAPQG